MLFLDDEFCHISFLFTGGKSPKIFKKGIFSCICIMYFLFLGLILYSSNNEYLYDIAEAPFYLHETSRLKPLSGLFEICITDRNKIDHVRCHDLRKESNLEYFMDEVYESNVNIVAVLLINSSDSLTLDPKLSLDNFKVIVPVYIVSSMDGDAISSASTGSHCKVGFSFTNDTEEEEPTIIHGRYP